MSHKWSFFVSGALVGALVSTAGFAFFLNGQKNGGEKSSQTVLKLGHGLDVEHPVHKAMEFMKSRVEELWMEALQSIFIRARFGIGNAKYRAVAEWYFGDDKDLRQRGEFYSCDGCL